jgi:hypothetical protein
LLFFVLVIGVGILAVEYLQNNPVPFFPMGVYLGDTAFFVIVGVGIGPGQSVSVTFSNEGDCSMTSKTDPHLNLKVTVNSTDSGDDSGD